MAMVLLARPDLADSESSLTPCPYCSKQRILTRPTLAEPHWAFIILPRNNDQLLAVEDHTYVSSNLFRAFLGIRSREPNA